MSNNIRRVDIVNLASEVTSTFYAEASAVDASEDSDEAAERIVANAEREGGGDLCKVEWWLADATDIDRADLRELVVERVAELIRHLRTTKR